MAHCTITLSDVVAAGGSVADAIEAWAREDDETSSGVIGSSFSTSGPGAGWSKQHDACDYAERALGGEHGAMHYIDSADGRVATLDDEGDVCWSDDSEVCLTCPEWYEACDDLDATVAMAHAVRDYHSAESDLDDWRRLIERAGRLWERSDTLRRLARVELADAPIGGAE